MRRLFFAVVGLLAATGCHGAKPEVEADVRPALTVVVGTASSGARAFVGSIEGRYTTELAFRVGGRVIRRSVSVGDRVKRGQEIAALDSQSLQLAVNAANADVAGVTASSATAETTLSRQTALLANRTVAQASFDDARVSHAVAVANVDAAEARLAKARQDLSYAILRADFDGVITRVDFEVEQVVAPNAPIAEIVRPDALDFVFDVPESLSRELDVGDPFLVRNTETPPVTTSGKVRQISPAADRATRTHRVWVALDAVPPHLRFGTTMYAEPADRTTAHLRVPLSAVLEDAGPPSLWIVDQDVVRRRAVTLGDTSDDSIAIETGLDAGERVVTAGVHSLRDGQRIKPTEESPR